MFIVVPLGCHWDATGMQRRFNTRSNTDMKIETETDTSTDADPTFNFHIDRLQVGCHWDTKALLYSY